MDQLKLAKTRWTTLKVQLRHFASSNLWHFVLLAMAAFLGKVSSDLLKMMGRGIFKPRRDIVDDTVVFMWNKILFGLAKESKAT